MGKQKKFVGIVGSYRAGGVIDTLVSEILDEAAANGASCSKIMLADRNIDFCTNCRGCTQPLGKARVPCVVHLHDDMNDILAEIDGADTIVLGAPVNLGSANALTQRFAERCVGYYYYPWGARYPVLRDKRRRRKAILVSGSAAPAMMNSPVFGASALTTLREIAKLVGAEVVETIRVGNVTTEDFHVPIRSLQKARQTAATLAA